jgi:tetratricopeptide (TPR) repeat protein
MNLIGYSAVVSCCWFMMISTAYSELTVMMPGATASENKQLNDALARPGVSPSSTNELVVRLGEVLKQYPDNRPVRIMRVRELAGLGRTSEARADVEYLSSKWPDDYKSNEARAAVDRVAGMRDGELAAYQAMAAAKPDNDHVAVVQAMHEPPSVLHARIQELQGDAGGAEKTWKGLISTAAASDLGLEHEYAEFLVRDGAYEDAADAYRKAIVSLEKLPGQQAFVSVVARDRLRLASALWASGKLSDASTQVDAALGVVEKWKDSLGNRSILLPEAALMSFSLHALTDIAGATRPVGSQALEFANSTATSDQTQDFDIAVAGLTGKIEVAAAVDQIESRLKEAPFFDPALWAETYLGLANPSLSKRAVEHLPKGTIQRAVFDKYGRGAS